MPTPTALLETARRLKNQGNFDDAEEVLYQAEGQLASAGDRTTRAQVREELGVLALHRGEHALAQIQFLRLLETPGDTGWEERVWRVRRWLGEIALATGDYAKAVKYLSTVWERATDYHDLDQLVGIAGSLVRALKKMGEHTHAQRIAETALEHAQRQGLEAHAEDLLNLIGD